MRPRISQAEAKFLLETLQARKEEIQGLIERKKQLDREVYQLRKLFLVNPYGAMKEGFKEKKEQLQQLERLSLSLSKAITCYDSLIAKFQVIASGEKHCGRYKSRATFYHWLLKDLVQTEPKST